MFFIMLYFQALIFFFLLGAIDYKNNTINKSMWIRVFPSYYLGIFILKLIGG